MTVQHAYTGLSRLPIEEVEGFREGVCLSSSTVPYMLVYGKK
jgi:hypothetical protein